MPYMRRYRRPRKGAKKKKKTYVRRRRYPSSATRAGRGLAPFGVPTRPRLAFPTSGMNTMLVYKENATITSTAGVDVLQQMKPNDMFDYDHTGNIGNKQPLYFDQLLTANGPYYIYTVYAWKTLIQVVNATANNLEVGFAENLDSTSCNTLAEIEDFPGALTRQLGPKDGAKNSCTFVVRNTINKITGMRVQDNPDYSGYYNSSTTAPVYQNLIVHDSGGSAITVKVKVVHVFKVRVWGSRAQASIFFPEEKKKEFELIELRTKTKK